MVAKQGGMHTLVYHVKGRHEHNEYHKEQGIWCYKSPSASYVYVGGDVLVVSIS